MGNKNNKKYTPEDIEKLLAENENDRLNVTKVQPVSVYRTAELIICLVAVIIGVLYLKTAFVSLKFVLPLYSLFFLCIPVLRYLDNKKNGVKGVAAWIVNIAWAIMAGAVLLATIVYFVKY